MSSKRILSGTRDFAGQRVGDFVISDYVSRHPQPRWAAVCQRCGTEHILAHQVLISGGARCLYAGCGKDAQREAANDTPRRMRERDEAAAAEVRREREAEEAAKVREAEAALTENSRKLRAIERENVLKLTDEDVYIDPSTASIRMTPDEANAYNREQAAIFRQRNPQYLASAANLEALGGYFERNGIRIASAETVQKAYERLDGLGLIEQGPLPIPVPISEPRQQPAKRAVPREEPKRPEGEMGIDPLTGLERFYTRREQAIMSSSEFRRRFPTYASVSELFSHDSR